MTPRRAEGRRAVIVMWCSRGLPAQPAAGAGAGGRRPAAATGRGKGGTGSEGAGAGKTQDEHLVTGEGEARSAAGGGTSPSRGATDDCATGGSGRYAGSAGSSIAGDRLHRLVDADFGVLRGDCPIAAVDLLLGQGDAGESNERAERKSSATEGDVDGPVHSALPGSRCGVGAEVTTTPGH